MATSYNWGRLLIGWSISSPATEDVQGATDREDDEGGGDWREEEDDNGVLAEGIEEYQQRE